MQRAMKRSSSGACKNALVMEKIGVLQRNLLLLLVAHRCMRGRHGLVKRSVSGDRDTLVSGLPSSDFNTSMNIFCNYVGAMNTTHVDL